MARILMIAACLCGFSQAQNTPAPRPQKQPAQSEQNPFEPIPPAQAPTIGPGVIECVDFVARANFRKILSAGRSSVKSAMLITKTPFVAMS
jgi:hypothetical protein